IHRLPTHRANTITVPVASRMSIVLGVGPSAQAGGGIPDLSSLALSGKLVVSGGATLANICGKTIPAMTATKPMRHTGIHFFSPCAGGMVSGLFTIARTLPRDDGGRNAHGLRAQSHRSDLAC